MDEFTKQFYEHMKKAEQHAFELEEAVDQNLNILYSLETFMDFQEKDARTKLVSFFRRDMKKKERNKYFAIMLFLIENDYDRIRLLIRDEFPELKESYIPLIDTHEKVLEKKAVSVALQHRLVLQSMRDLAEKKDFSQDIYADFRLLQKRYDDEFDCDFPFCNPESEEYVLCAGVRKRFFIDRIDYMLEKVGEAINDRNEPKGF